MVGILDALKMTAEDRAKLSNEEFFALLAEVEACEQEFRHTKNLLYYEPVSQKAREFHLSSAKTRCLFGGNGSSKSESMLVDMCIMMTGLIPFSLRPDYPHEKIKCPAHYRLVVESLTTTLHPVILPKLQWWHWDGIDDPGGKRGHWGWIPKQFLIGWDWNKSWSEKTRILRLTCGCMIQFMSHDQDPTDFESGAFHCIGHDEPPSKAIWGANRARVARRGGHLLLAMTPPPDAGIAVDWLYDELYEKGMPGPNKDPEISCWHLDTMENKHQDLAEVRKRAAQMGKQERETRLLGRFAHLSNRIHPLFTDKPSWWCFTCNERILGAIGAENEAKVCPMCEGTDIVEFCHRVEAWEGLPGWPTVQLIDPHPRQPHKLAWITLDPSDDACVVQELSLDAEPAAIWEQVKNIEEDLHLSVVKRLMDPNMGASPSNSQKREMTWQREFGLAGLRCDLAQDAFETGKTRINEALKPCPRRRRPRLLVHKRCQGVVYQLQRFAWDEWGSRSDSRDPKERPRAKHGDYPALLRYFYNANLSYDSLKLGGEILSTRARYARSGRGREARQYA